MKKTLKIGMNRGKARIWIEGNALAVMGWERGTKFVPSYLPGTIVYARTGDAGAKGGRAVAGTAVRPIIDTNTDKIRTSLGNCSHVVINITEDTITITPSVPAAKTNEPTNH